MRFRDFAEQNGILGMDPKVPALGPIAGQLSQHRPKRGSSVSRMMRFPRMNTRPAGIMHPTIAPASK